MKKKQLTWVNVLIIAITIIVGLTITGSWGDFKRGLKGAPPVENHNF
ncbi:hypothetical protein KI659_06915 [Litoribacter alkaliphilus]|uniref:Uncharacterized protein n=1 Tax=Litoribacter ruber TaxID=702568 RepID=A0AAP2G4R7_9BACT|nr:hypothetical protein [Litoribacter alkaliphilus]MBS9523748.1 hypothetical protein [Litoribacter alkaliphilus]